MRPGKRYLSACQTHAAGEVRLQGRAIERLTLKCRIFPGGWLPTIWPQMAATPGSLKVVHSFALLPASQDKAVGDRAALQVRCSARQTQTSATTVMS